MNQQEEDADSTSLIKCLTLMVFSTFITFNCNVYMKKERKIKNENGAKKQQKTTFLMQMIYCDRRM